MRGSTGKLIFMFSHMPPPPPPPRSGILTSAAQNILGESQVDWTNIGDDEFTIVE